MCVQDAEQVAQDIDNRRRSWPLHCELKHTQMENLEKTSSLRISSDSTGVENSFPVSNITIVFLP